MSRPRVVEPLGAPERHERPGLLRSEQIREDAAPMVGVVHEQQQVAQADERVRVPRRRGQRVGPAVYIAHHVNPHETTLGRARIA